MHCMLTIYVLLYLLAPQTSMYHVVINYLCDMFQMFKNVCYDQWNHFIPKKSTENMFSYYFNSEIYIFSSNIVLKISLGYIFCLFPFYSILKKIEKK